MGGGYDIVTAKEDDKERIAEFLRKYFYSCSPLHVASGLSPNRRTDEISALKYLYQGTSHLAVSKDDGRILGVSINYYTSPKDNAITVSFNESLSNEPHAKISRFQRFMEDNAKIWRITGADRGLYSCLWSVDATTRGRGIARALLQRGFEVARSMGYPMLWCICGSAYSIHICRSLRMDAVYALPYSEYKDKDGKPIFNVPHPNTVCVVFVQKLNSKLWTHFLTTVPCIVRTI